MITSFVPLAASVLLTAQHLACAASCQEGPDFSFRQGVGEGTDICIHGEAFAKRIRPFPWLPLLLVVWPQYCWKTTPLSSRCSTLRVPDGRLVGVSSSSVRFCVQCGQAGHIRSLFLKFPLLVDKMPFSSYFQAFLFFHGSWGGMAGHPKHSALARQLAFSLPGQQKQDEAGCQGALGKIPAHRLVCSHP